MCDRGARASHAAPPRVHCIHHRAACAGQGSAVPKTPALAWQQLVHLVTWQLHLAPNYAARCAPPSQRPLHSPLASQAVLLCRPLRCGLTHHVLHAPCSRTESVACCSTVVLPFLLLVSAVCVCLCVHVYMCVLNKNVLYNTAVVARARLRVAHPDCMLHRGLSAVLPRVCTLAAHVSAAASRPPLVRAITMSAPVEAPTIFDRILAKEVCGGWVRRTPALWTRIPRCT